MNQGNLYILIHSPLIGGLTWTLVADQMLKRGLKVLVPILNDSPNSNKPFWKQHADSISQAFAGLSKDASVTLVTHSGAGPLLPAIRQSIAYPVNAYVFVDAGIPRNGASRLDLMKLEDPEWAKQFQEELEHGKRFPNWSLDDLEKIIPDETLRRQIVDEIRPARVKLLFRTNSRIQRMARRSLHLHSVQRTIHATSKLCKTSRLANIRVGSRSLPYAG